MNIFYLHPNPNKAAAYHYDKHKVKMILEAAQMLCTAHHHYAELYEYDGSYIPYRKAHYNHPSTKWARENMQTYFWLYDYMMALGEEYTKRYKKKHLSITKCAKVLLNPPKGMQNGHFTMPPQCMPDEYKVLNNSLKAYWNYYINNKKSIINKDENLILSTLLMSTISTSDLTVTATIYHATIKQTDSTPDRTATNFKINMNNPESHRIIAVSRDLETKGFKMNSVVVISNAGDMNGLWVIRDRMNKRWTNRIDFLVDETLKGGKWNNVKIKLYEYN